MGVTLYIRFSHDFFSNFVFFKKYILFNYIVAIIWNGSLPLFNFSVRSCRFRYENVLNLIFIKESFPRQCVSQQWKKKRNNRFVQGGVNLASRAEQTSRVPNHFPVLLLLYVFFHAIFYWRAQSYFRPKYQGYITAVGPMTMQLVFPKTSKRIVARWSHHMHNVIFPVSFIIFAASHCHFFSSFV